MTSSPEILIAGGGPVGLVAALTLQKNGTSFRIVDKAPLHAVGQRGAGIAPRTLETYHFVGVLPKIKSVGGPLVPFQEYDPISGLPTRAWDIAPRVSTTPEVPEPNHWMLGQDTNCSIIRKALEARGVQVETGTELVSFAQDENGVDVILKKDGKEEKLRVRFLLGADGARGVTRKQLAVRFVGDSQDIKMIIGDIELTGVDRDHWHRYMDDKRNTVMLRPVWENPKQFFIVASGPSLDIQRAIENRDYLVNFIHSISKNEGITITGCETLAEWHLNVRMVDKFHVDRVVLAGDAAHVHTPAGGQGLNSGVMDAMNVSWKLALICKELAPLSLLDSYDNERVPVIKEMLQFTTGLFMNMMKPQGQTSSVSWSRPLSLRQLGVHCRWSNIVRDEFQDEQEHPMDTNIEPPSTYGSDEGNRLHAGDRAPDAPGLVHAQSGKLMRLFDIFHPGRHTIIVFDLDVKQVTDTLSAKYSQEVAQIIAIQDGKAEISAGSTVFRDSEGHARRAYGALAGVRVAIIRPDGVVGALLKTTDGATEYFSRIFSA